MQIPNRSIIALVLFVAYIIFFSPISDSAVASSPWWVLSGPVGFVIAAVAVWPFSWLLATESESESEGPQVADLMLVGIAGMLLSRWIDPVAVMLFPYLVMAGVAAVWRWKSMSLAWVGTLSLIGVGLFAASQGFESHLHFTEHLGLLILLAISAFVLLLGGNLMAVFFAIVVTFGRLFSDARLEDYVWEDLPDFVRACYGGLSVAVVVTCAVYGFGFELPAVAGWQLYLGTPMLFATILLITRVQGDRKMVSV